MTFDPVTLESRECDVMVEHAIPLKAALLNDVLVKLFARSLSD